MQPARRRGATCAVTGCSGCTRTIQGTVHRTVRRPRARAPGAARSRRGRRRRRAAGEFFGALGAAWPLTAAQRSRLTPAVLAALNAGWTPHELARFAGANAGGVRNPYAVLTARPAAVPAAVVRRMRRAHPDGRLLQRRAEPLPALQADGPRAAAQPQPRQPAPPAWRSCAAGEHWRPGGPAQSPPGAPQRCARCHLRPGPGPGLCTPAMTIPDGERTLPQYAPQGRCRLCVTGNGDFSPGARRRTSCYGGVSVGTDTYADLRA